MLTAHMKVAKFDLQKKLFEKDIQDIVPIKHRYYTC